LIINLVQNKICRELGTLLLFNYADERDVLMQEESIIIFIGSFKENRIGFYQISAEKYKLIFGF